MPRQVSDSVCHMLSVRQWQGPCLDKPGSSAIYMGLFDCRSSYYINPYELSTKPNALFKKLSFNDIYSSEKACLIEL